MPPAVSACSSRLPIPVRANRPSPQNRPAQPSLGLRAARRATFVQASRSPGFSATFASAVLRDEPVLFAALRCPIGSPMAVRPVGGRLREGLVQVREGGDHAVNAGDRENPEDVSGGEDQQQHSWAGR